MSFLPRPGSGAFTPALLCLVLLAGLAAQVAWPVETAFAPRERGTIAPARSPVASPVPDYAALIARPLFSPDRRTTGGGSGETSPDAHRPSLVGVVSDQRAGSAVVRGADGAAQVVRVGQAWRGWRLVSVGRRTAIFDGPGGRVVAAIDGAGSSASISSSSSSSQEVRP
jgi:general secretion pathway protein N